MKKTKRKMLTVGLVLITLLSACQKEPISRLILTSEGMAGGAKMTVNGLASYWQTGDAVNINGEASSITVSGSQAYVDGEFSADNYCVVFPASIYQSRSGSVVTVNMPASYQYKTSGGHQVLDAPMAYLGTAENGRVMMKHLTGALNFEITGPAGISIDCITISTYLPSNRKMSGEMQFDLSDIENIGSTAQGSVLNDDYTVQMFFDLESFSTGTVQVPIPVLTGNVTFDIKVVGHVNGTKYVFSRFQLTSGHLGRATLGTVAIDFNDQNYVTTSALFSTVVDEGITYYKISTPQDLRLMSEAVCGTYYRENGDWEHRDWTYNNQNYKDANYYIYNTINMEGIPIKSIKNFSGVMYGGNNNYITNLTVVENTNSDDVDRDQVGLFTYPNGATIRKVSFEDLTVVLDETGDPLGGYIGAIAGVSYGIIIDDIYIHNFRINESYQNRIVLGGFIGSATSSDSIYNSWLVFADNQVITSGGSSYWNSNYGSFGGITGRRECKVISTTVFLKNTTFRIEGYGENISSAKCLMGGLFGTTYSSLTPDASKYRYNSIKGNVTVSGYSNVYTGKVYNYYNSGIYYSSTDSFDGVDVSQLTINGE